MIIFSPKVVEWTSEDSSRLKTFLESPTGHRMLQIVDIAKPSLLDGTHKNKTLVASGRVDGFNEVLEVIFKLTYEDPNAPVVPEVVSENYKSLDDDAAWAEDEKPAVDNSSKTPTS